MDPKLRTLREAVDRPFDLDRKESPLAKRGGSGSLEKARQKTLWKPLTARRERRDADNASAQYSKARGQRIHARTIDCRTLRVCAPRRLARTELSFQRVGEDRVTFAAAREQDRVSWGRPLLRVSCARRSCSETRERNRERESARAQAVGAALAEAALIEFGAEQVEFCAGGVDLRCGNAGEDEGDVDFCVVAFDAHEARRDEAGVFEQRATSSERG